MSGVRKIWIAATLGTAAVAVAGCWLYVRRRRQRRESARQRRIAEVHAEAVAKGETGYFDPETGLFVFTATQHLSRGYCCGSGCRHCPYDHVNVPENKAAAEAAELASKASVAASGVSLGKSPLFTRTGDRGITTLSTGERRSKDHPVIVVMGDLDELNSQIGLTHTVLIEQQTRLADDTDRHPDILERYELMGTQLRFVQHKLFDVGGSAGSAGDTNRAKKAFKKAHVIVLEEWIRDLTNYLPNIASFIIPSGGLLACQLHVSRTVCRRAERSLVLLNGIELVDPPALEFINRLSDYLFAAARLAQHLERQPDVPVRRGIAWVPPPAPAATDATP